MLIYGNGQFNEMLGSFFSWYEIGIRKGYGRKESNRKQEEGNGNERIGNLGIMRFNFSN